MPRIRYSEASRQDLIRAYAFLDAYDSSVASRAVSTIVSNIEGLLKNPYGGSPVDDRPRVRKLVVAFGATGYLVFHQYYELDDTSLILAILHQKELYDANLVGLNA